MGFKDFYLEATTEPKEYSEEELKARQGKKTGAMRTLSDNIRKIKVNVAKDLKSEDEKTQLTALAIAVINATRERVGNDKSAQGLRKDENGEEVKGDKHYGVTGLRKKHVTFYPDGKVVLKYTGKSGVDQVKTIRDKKIVEVMKKFYNMNDGFLFTTSNGQKIQATQVNNYLKKYDVSAKDLRGYGGNDRIIKLLNNRAIPQDEKERKKVFLDVAQKVADELGHSRTMLRKSYLLPNLEDTYINSGKVINIKEV